MFTQNQAIEIAKAAFPAQQGPASDFNITVETYHADANQWIVWFDKKGPFPVPGGKHAVLVHKATGQAVFMPGE